MGDLSGTSPLANMCLSVAIRQHLLQISNKKWAKVLTPLKVGHVIWVLIRLPLTALRDLQRRETIIAEECFKRPDKVFLPPLHCALLPFTHLEDWRSGDS